MLIEKIIEKILSTNPETSRAELLERLAAEKKKTSGLISDKSLLRVIAAELGVTIPSWSVAHPLLLSNLVPNLNNVTVAGRVVAVFSTRHFRMKTNGKVSSLLIADQSGLIRVVLWNEKTELIESNMITIGLIVRFFHGYTREGRSGEVELHLGNASDIEINPKHIEANDYPTIEKFLTPIGQITPKNKKQKIHIRGRIKKVFPIFTFQRKNSTIGKVMRFVISDGADEISGVIWNEKADELEKLLKTNIELQIVNAKVKKTGGDEFELHINSDTYVETLVRP